MTAIIFDLDGTLIDSVPDIHKAASEMLAEAGHSPLGISKIRSFIGNGVPALITKIMREINENPEDGARHAVLEQCFMRYYMAAPAVLSTPFDNVRMALDALSTDGFKLAVCTNKPERIAKQILHDLNMASYFLAVIGGDSLPVRKPDPAPLHAAIAKAGATSAIYVGDSEIDSETAQNAQIPFILFTEGYRRGSVSEIQHQAVFSDFSQLPNRIQTIRDDMSGDWIVTLDDLHAHYGQPGAASQIKVTAAMTPAYRAHIARSRFCVLTTVGPEGTDCSPRGDEGPIVTIKDERTLLLPDWKGNERIDSLRNIVRDGRVSLLFLIAGSNIAMRVNGNARVTPDSEALRGFDRQGKTPRSVIVIRIEQVYFQCARALIRSGLWTDPHDIAGLPTVGDMLAEITSGEFDGATYDIEWPERAARTMW